MYKDATSLAITIYPQHWLFLVGIEGLLNFFAWESEDFVAPLERNVFADICPYS